MAGSGFLVGPDGVRVEPVELQPVDVAYARRRHRDAKPGDVFFLVTRHGRLLGYCRDIEEVAELVDLRLLHGPDDAAESGGAAG
ncbi:hypothetical protein [Actinomadura decatromicini]|uniref:Uncharacterized protein n=1 Tax=Actinomadura decatromicini TaxID=2604572 RepID=A0A5D3FB82_9ACTN|nr:hypothetical protein [Actinomadura decatromicini]TYK45096.1 hypothetical protein FXF68_30915 [Actinomadura decatromicini]